MARLPRLVLPDYPYHVTQRGNRRQDGDYALYRDLIAEAADRAGAEIWCYCLMPNHIHIIVVPSDGDGLRRTFADAHRRYTGFINARHRWTGFINARHRWTGHLWQGRYGAVVMDECHLAHAMRYVSLNPVRALLASRAQDWQWSSVRAHLAGTDDGLVRVAPAIERYGDFSRFLGMPDDYTDAWQALRRSETTGRPLGSSDWIAALEAKTGKALAPRKRGPKPKAPAAGVAKTTHSAPKAC